MKNSEKAAYPVTINVAHEGSDVAKGLTKREYFAAMAMQGLITANPIHTHGNIDLPVPSYVAQLSTGYADELLKALEK